MNEKDIDKAIESELIKDITQEDKVDKVVNESMGQMGFLYDTTLKKLGEDKTCYHCKKALADKEKSHVVPVMKSEKGLMVFANLCYDCVEKLKNEQEEIKNE